MAEPWGISGRSAGKTELWAVGKWWLRNSWGKLEHPQEKWFIDLVASVLVAAGGTESATGTGGSSPGTSLHFCPWLCVKRQESGQGVNHNSDLILIFTSSKI